MPRKASGKPKRNIWTDETSPYGTYEGERGNPEDWANAFHFAWDRKSAIGIIKEESPYAILGVLENASIAEIKKAFRKLMIINHPDKGGNLELCQKIISAYIILTKK